MANPSAVSFEEQTKEKVDAHVAAMSDAEAVQMLCYYVICTGEHMVLRYTATNDETPRGRWMRTLARRVIKDQKFDPDYFALPPGATP